MTYLPFTAKADTVDTIHAADVNNLQTGISDLSFNVKGYGAVGDDATNDTVAVQAALDAANTAGGGVVFFPRGTYQCNKLTFYTKVSLVGVGPETSIIKLRATQNTALLTSSGFVTTNVNAGIYGFTIANLSFDGNGANQASNGDSGVVQIYGYNWRMERVKIRNGKSVNLYSNWGTLSSAPGPNGISMEATLVDVETYAAVLDGIYWNGPHDSMWSQVIAHENLAKGFNIDPRGSNLVASDCHSWGSSQVYAWVLNGAGCLLSNCTGEGASANQVYIGTGNQSIHGGTYYAAGGGATGILFGASVTGCFLCTTVQGFTTAGVAMGTNDGGGNVLILNFESTAGAAWTGTRAASTMIQTATRGGAAGKFAILPNGLAIDGGTNIDPGLPFTRNAAGAWVLNASGGGILYLNFDAGTGGISFGDGAGTVVGTILPGGNLKLNGMISPGQSATAPAIATAGTITTASIGVARLAPAGAVTGVIMQAGTVAGQTVTVVNESAAASTITMAAAATSNVADGVSTVIAGLTAARFVWDTSTSRWYHCK